MLVLHPHCDNTSKDLKSPMHYPRGIARNIECYESTHTMKDGYPSRANIKQSSGRSVLTDPEEQAKMEMEIPRSSGVNSPPNAHDICFHVKTTNEGPKTAF
ncbi:hypothetical protein Tco_0760406, partial [Tanacetum coccineum]